MTTHKRTAFVLLVWAIFALAVLRWTVPWPARDDDDYSKWLIVSVVSALLPWIVDLRTVQDIGF